MVLARRDNSPWVDMSLHSNTLSWFQANQSLLFLLNATCLVEKQQIPVFGLNRPGLESTIYSTKGVHARHYTTDTTGIHDLQH
jgi:hypothetical protein